MITVVSGMPRSGTSMMMQMLKAAGLEICSDEQRLADEDNPNGYFELASAKRLKDDSSFLEGAVGRVVKVVAPLLPFLPGQFDYRVVFMEREIEEVMASQQAMLDRSSGERGDDSAHRALSRAFENRTKAVKEWLEKSRNVEVCYVAHFETMNSPIEVSGNVLRFLDRTHPSQRAILSDDLRQATASRMADVVDRSLYRQRQATPVTGAC